MMKLVRIFLIVSVSAVGVALGSTIGTLLLFAIFDGLSSEPLRWLESYRTFQLLLGPIALVALTGIAFRWLDKGKWFDANLLLAFIVAILTGIGRWLLEINEISSVLLLASLMVAATPIMLAAIGELVVERAGVLNLGVEGMMITGAITGFMIAYATQSPVLGFIGAAAGGAALSLVFGVLTQYLLSNQVATGLALTLFGTGLASLLGEGYIGIRAPSVPKLDIPVLSDIPVLGPILFQHDAMVYVGLLIPLAVWWFLRFTRGGLILRAVGESHDAAHALGYKVTLIRMMAIAFGGACAGLGGAYLGVVRVPQWTEGVTAGAGWIALAIVVFASWRPGRLVTGAYLFGGIGVLQLNLQAARAPIPVEVLSMSPYIATIVALVILSARKSGGSTAAPAALGIPFHASR